MQPGVLPVTMRWVVCGAGRKVGKTHLARQLCEVLPHAVYAKQGHGKPDKRKPPNYFRDHEALGRFLARCEGRSEHVVVESNELARRGEGDVIIYVDAPSGMAEVRDDAARLMQAADVRVAASSTMRDWRRALRGPLPDTGLREGVCQALWAQKRHLFADGLAVRSKVWFVCDGEHVFGPGLARLLEGVERHGTLSAAARAEGICTGMPGTTCGRPRSASASGWSCAGPEEPAGGSRGSRPRAGGCWTHSAGWSGR